MQCSCNRLRFLYTNVLHFDITMIYGNVQDEHAHDRYKHDSTWHGVE